MQLVSAIVTITVKCTIYGAFRSRKVLKNTVMIDNFSNEEWQQLNNIFAKCMYIDPNIIKFSSYKDFNIISLIDLIKNLRCIYYEYKNFLIDGIEYRYKDIHLGLPIVESRLRAGSARFTQDHKSALYLQA